MVFHRYVSLPEVYTFWSVISKDMNGGLGDFAAPAVGNPAHGFVLVLFLLQSYPPNMHDSSKRGYHGDMIDQLDMIFVQR